VNIYHSWGDFWRVKALIFKGCHRKVVFHPNPWLRLFCSCLKCRQHMFLFMEIIALTPHCLHLKRTRFIIVSNVIDWELFTSFMSLRIIYSDGVMFIWILWWISQTFACRLIYTNAIDYSYRANCFTKTMCLEYSNYLFIFRLAMCVETQQLSIAIFLWLF